MTNFLHVIYLKASENSLMKSVQITSKGIKHYQALLTFFALFLNCSIPR